MLKNSRIKAHVTAIFEASLVAIIWGSSFVFVKIGLKFLGPLTLAGLRYFIAFIILLPFMFMQKKPFRYSKNIWYWLSAIGLSAYVIGNGALFWGLKYLTATTGSFMMSSVPVLILLTGILWLKEYPTLWQYIGLLFCVLGSVLFFAPGSRFGELRGILILAIGMIGFAAFGILGRKIARERLVTTLPLTALPLAIGGGCVLLLGLIIEGRPIIPIDAWVIVLWLAVVNTAFAYILYNHALRLLTALEINTILNLSPLITAIIAWILLGEKLGGKQIIGMVIVILGVSFVQNVKIK